MSPVTPTLDGDVLAVLAGAETEMTGRQVQRALGRASDRGVRLVLDRLTSQGVVLRRRAGRANLYTLNRDHLAACAIESLASIRLRLFERMRDAVRGWEPQPHGVVLFGSVVRGEAGTSSDIDILVVRRATVESEDERWENQLAALGRAVTAWTGNDARLLQYSEHDFAQAGAEGVVRSALREGVEIQGSLRALRRLAGATA